MHRSKGTPGGLLRISDEAGVMPVERREQATDVGSEPTGNRRSSNSQWKAAAFAIRAGQARIFNASTSREIDAAFATFVRDQTDALFVGRHSRGLD
jgi:hypothetical protein